MEYSGAGGKLIHEKNQKQKISWHCPFELIIFTNFKNFNIVIYSKNMMYNVLEILLVSSSLFGNALYMKLCIFKTAMFWSMFFSMQEMSSAA